MRLMAISLAFVAGNIALAALSLQGAYRPGQPLELLWMVAGVFQALAAQTRTWRSRHEAEILAVDAVPPLDGPTVSLLPYAFVAVGYVLLPVAAHGNLPGLDLGVYVGVALLTALVITRQVLVLRENARLYREARDELAERRRAEARLEALSTTDALNGLPNHRALNVSIDHEIERTHRYRRPFALLFLDVDHFKALNDSFGHPCGDALLRELGQVLRLNLRGPDAIGRWGGEEFLAILPETTAEDARVVAEKVRSAVASHHFGTGGGHLTCSIGTAGFPDDATGRDDLIGLADRALYVAKRLGRNQVRAASEAAVLAVADDSAARQTREDVALLGTVGALAALVDARDHYTGDHSESVSWLAREIATALGLGASEVRMLTLAARLHDIGKVVIPDAVLLKPGRLTDEEWRIVRTHVAVGAEVIRHVPGLVSLSPIIEAHHERWDGSGYPHGLKGEAIPLGARIVAVADSYHAMTSDRPYRSAASIPEALDELRRCAGSQFDPQIVAVFEQLLALRESNAASLVRAS